MTSQETVEYIQNLLSLWDVRYDKSGNSFIATTTTNAVIGSDEMYWFSQLRLKIYNIQKFKNTISVSFFGDESAD